jgi:hypothetical protein
LPVFPRLASTSFGSPDVNANLRMLLAAIDSNYRLADVVQEGKT